MISSIKHNLLRFFFVIFLGTFDVYAADIENGVTHINQQELEAKLNDSNTVLIDIRTQEEVEQGFIPGAKHIPLAQIKNNISLLDEYADKDLIFYCHSGTRVRKLTDYLQEIDHSSKDSLHHLKGDMRAWRARGNEVQTE